MRRKLALLGGEPLRKRDFYHWPNYGNGEIENLKTALESRKWGRFGPLEKKFCDSFAAFQGGKYAVCVTSGMTALFAALKILGVHPGDEIIVPAFPQPPALSICYVGAIPIFVDIEERSLCIDHARVLQAITPKTRAIIVIHTHNTMGNMDEILEIKNRYNIPIIEDCAHAHGMKWDNRGAGYIGDVGIFSFENSKAMTCGEGGLITTNKLDYFRKAIAFRNLGNDWKGKKDADVIGWNFRITEFHAAILLAQLGRLPEQIDRKLKNIKLFESLVNNIDGIKYIRHHEKVSAATGFLYTLIYEKEKFEGIPINAFVQALKAEGLPARMRDLSYTSPEMKKYIKQFNIKPHCPLAEVIVKEKLFTLPHQVFLGSDDDIEDAYNILVKVTENILEIKRSKMKQLVRRVKHKFIG